MRTHGRDGVDGSIRTAVALLILTPGVALADPGVCSSTLADEGRARQFRSEATALIESGGDPGQAALLLERSVGLSSVCSPETFDALRLAARLYAHEGDFERALRAMIEAAEHGIAVGELVQAAHALVDATELAILIGDTEMAWQAAGRAESLADSPEVDPQNRDWILERIRVGNLRAGNGTLERARDRQEEETRSRIFLPASSGR